MKRLSLILLAAVVLLSGCAFGGMGLNITDEAADVESPVLTWHREGGFAGFCDDVAVYADGRAVVTSCNEAADEAETVLSAEQAQMLEEWSGRLSSFDQELSDEAVADGIIIAITFDGGGAAAASPADIEAMGAFAEALLRQARQETN